MRAFFVVALSAVALLVGCGRDEDTLNRPRTPGGGASSSSGGEGTAPPGTTNPGTTTTPPSPAVTACSAAAAPTALSDAKDANEVHIAGKAVFFRSGQSVVRVLKDGKDKKTVFTSPNLVRAFADRNGLLLIDKTDDGNPNATLRAYTAKGSQAPAEGEPAPPAAEFPEFPVVEGEDPGGTTAATNFSALSAQVFGADGKNYYALAEENNTGNSLVVAIDRTTLTQTNIVNEAETITNPVLSGGAIYWVQEGQRIKKITLATETEPQGTATEIFGLGQCNLAVSDSAAFCSVGATIETRDLTGKNAKTLMSAGQSKSTAPFGDATWLDGKLYVRSVQPDAEVKHFLRSITSDGAESFVACNRAAIKDFTADATDLVWAEEGVGVFMVKK